MVIWAAMFVFATWDTIFGINLVVRNADDPFCSFALPEIYLAIRVGNWILLIVAIFSHIQSLCLSAIFNLIMAFATQFLIGGMMGKWQYYRPRMSNYCV